MATRPVLSWARARVPSLLIHGIMSDFLVVLFFPTNFPSEYRLLVIRENASKNAPKHLSLRKGIIYTEKPFIYLTAYKL